MFILTAAILIAAGIVIGSILDKYWNHIRGWLNNNVANLVEQVLGYNARKGLLKVVSTADRVFRIVQNRRVATNNIISYAMPSEGVYKKLALEYDSPAEEWGQGYLDEMQTASNVIAMDYRK